MKITVKKVLSAILVLSTLLVLQTVLVGVNAATSDFMLKVGISDSSQTTLDHSSVSIVSANGFTLKDPVTDTTFNIGANATVSFSNTSGIIYVKKNGATLYSSTNKLICLPLVTKPTLKITSITRAYGNPVYRGNMYVTAENAPIGKLRIINEVSLEKYLYQVVPSEMGTTFPLEALKVQSVAARTYALNECFSGRFSDDGIDVWDSVLSQVYNNAPENNTTNSAIDATAGYVLKYNEQYIDAKFYSTSGGYGANAHEIWADPVTNAFPSTPLPYFSPRSYIYAPANPSQFLNIDTASESVLNAFYKTLSYTGYDQNSAYFRWKVKLTRQQLENTVSKNIKLRYAAEPAFVLTKDSNGNFVSKPIPAAGIGTLQNMYASKRGAGGNMMELVVVGSTGTYKVIREYNVRFTIRPNKTDTGSGSDIIMYRAKGGSSTYDGTLNLLNPSILPSGFCSFDLYKDSPGNITEISFYGGGNGHGVGMSQYGASYLAGQGKTYNQILAIYYPNAQLVIDSPLTPQTVIIDDDSGSPGFTQSGSWTVSTGIGYKNGHYRYASVGAASTATWTANLNGGNYEVFVFYTSGTNRTTAANYRITTASGTATKTVNQQTNGSTWVSLGIYNLSPGINTVELDTTQCTGGSVAITDSVKLIRKPSVPQILDDDSGSPDFTQNGSWIVSTGIGYNNGHYRYASVGAASIATWTANLNGGNYEVFVYYSSGTNRSTAVSYSISTSSGTVTKIINQQTNGSTWVSLGTYYFAVGNSTVILNASQSTGGSVVIADTVKFEQK